MRKRFKVFDGNILRNYALRKSFTNWVGHVGFVGARGTGRNTLCERFGQLEGGDIKRCERKALRELIIDHSQENAPVASQGNRKTLLFMHVIFFLEDGVERCYLSIVSKLKVVVFMFDVTKVDSLEYARTCWKEFKSHLGASMPPCIFVGNKMDKRVDTNRHHIYTDFGRHVAYDLGAKSYFECSAKRCQSCLPLAEYVMKEFIHITDP
ncbi:hypothetical protein TNCV_1436791 [Trichonephila clavipes]|nr:hypothetical protein TNCV_1436791 [Trichonephila clavipes]